MNQGDSLVKRGQGRRSRGKQLAQRALGIHPVLGYPSRREVADYLETAGMWAEIHGDPESRDRTQRYVEIVTDFAHGRRGRERE